MATHKHMDKARQDARNVGAEIRKDAAGLASAVKTDMKKARADLASGVDRMRGRSKRRRSGK